MDSDLEEWSKKMTCGLGGPPLPEGPEPEGFGGSGANTIDAAVYAEDKSVALPGGNQIATAVRAQTAVAEMLFNVATDLIEIIDDIATRREKEIISNHGPSADLSPSDNSVLRSEVPTD